MGASCSRETRSLRRGRSRWSTSGRWEYMRKFTGAKHVATKSSRIDGWTPKKVWETKIINYRSRLVGRELHLDRRNDLFAPTPPLEAMKALTSLCAKSQDGREPIRFATIDIKRAYFDAPATRKMFIKLPAEDCLPGEEDMVGELKLSLHLNKIGFQKGRET